MEPQNLEHKKCFKQAKAYVRNELKVDKFLITNQKIIRYCWELDNNADKVKSALKAHFEKMTSLDLKRIEALPKSFCQPCKSLRPTSNPAHLHGNAAWKCLFSNQDSKS